MNYLKRWHELAVKDFTTNGEMKKFNISREAAKIRKDLQNVLRFVMAGLGHCIGHRFSRLVTSHEKSQNGVSVKSEKQHFFKETVAFIFSACTRAEKLTPHLHFLRVPALSLSNGLRGFV